MTTPLCRKQPLKWPKATICGHRDFAAKTALVSMRPRNTPIFELCIYINSVIPLATNIPITLVLPFFPITWSRGLICADSQRFAVIGRFGHIPSHFGGEDSPTDSSPDAG